MPLNEEAESDSAAGEAEVGVGGLSAEFGIGGRGFSSCAAIAAGALDEKCEIVAERDFGDGVEGGVGVRGRWTRMERPDEATGGDDNLLLPDEGETVSDLPEEDGEGGRVETGEEEEDAEAEVDAGLELGGLGTASGNGEGCTSGRGTFAEEEAGGIRTVEGDGGVGGRSVEVARSSGMAGGEDPFDACGRSETRRGSEPERLKPSRRGEPGLRGDIPGEGGGDLCKTFRRRPERRSGLCFRSLMRSMAVTSISVEMDYKKKVQRVTVECVCV